MHATFLTRLWLSLALLFVFSAAPALTACSDEGGHDGGDNGCIPGKAIGCTCPGGRKGGQVCHEDGSGYDACLCDGSDEPATFGAGGKDTGGWGGWSGGSAGSTLMCHAEYESCMDGLPCCGGIPCQAGSGTRRICLRDE